MSTPPRREGSRPVRSALTAVVALAAIGGAYWNFRRLSAEAERPANEPPPIERPAVPPKPTAAAPPVPQEPLARFRSAVRLDGGPVALGAVRAQSRTSSRYRRGLLASELFRQALLLAARDELHLPTRDGSLGEPAAAPEGPAVAELTLGYVDRWVPILTLERAGAASEADRLVRREMPAVADERLLPSVVLAESLSREAFPAALTSLGAVPGPANGSGEADVAEGVEALLGRPDALAQFAAVRALHAEVRSRGESGRRLGALARGYATLGALTETLWAPLHKAAKARGLLYAQRLVAREPGSAWGLWHRAYALALAGLHREALDDLEAAATLPPPSGGAPGWVPLVESLCRFDLRRLGSQPDPSTARLAALFRLLASEFPRGSTLGVAAARDLLALEPGCDRAVEALCRSGRINALHAATEAAPRVLEATGPRRIAAVPGLPASIGAKIEDGVDVDALAAALRDPAGLAEDRGEPTRAALGHLVRETRFLQAAERLRFMRVNWGVPTGDEYAAWRPRLEDHPLRPYLDFFGPVADLAAVDAFLHSLDGSEIEVIAAPMYMLKGSGGASGGDFLRRRANDNADPCFRDVALIISEAVPGGGRQEAERLVDAISPYAPFAMAYAIRANPDMPEVRLREWLARGVEHPELEAALGYRAVAKGQLEEGARRLQAYVDRVPDLKATIALADAYEKLGRRDAWRKALDDALKEDDGGLGHARIRTKLAVALMAEGKPEEAEPYAAAAAETWAAFGMQCATECYERLGRWEQAELWVRRLSERYPDNLSDWFFWCVRTGKGDREAARDLAAPMFEAEWGNAQIRFRRGAFAALNGRPREAYEILRRLADETKSDADAGVAGMLADALGEDAARDELLRRVIAANPGGNVAAILNRLLDWLPKGDPAALDGAAVAESFGKLNPKARSYVGMVAGPILVRHGRADVAIPMLEAAVPVDVNWAQRALARAALDDARATERAGR